MTATRRRTRGSFAQTLATRTPAPIRYALGGALVVAAVHVSLDANAYCQTVSKTPAGWDEATQGCFVGTGVADARLLYWKNACVGYDLQQDASRQVTLAQATAIAASAFAGWHDVGCAGGGGPSLSAVDLGPVACGEVRYNKTNANQNVIVFRDDTWPHTDPNSTLGLTTVSYDVETGAIFGADLEINSTLPLIVSARVGEGEGRAAAANAATPAGYDLATIVSHEAGHFLGLAHSALESAIMAAHYKEGAHMTDDDVAGICAVYPSDGTRKTSSGFVNAAACDSTPPHGFSSQCAGPRTDTPSEDGDGGCAVHRLPSSGRASTVASVAMLMGLAFFVRRARRR